MLPEYIERLRYSNPEQNVQESTFPQILKRALGIILSHKTQSNNKICIALPAKEYAAQWLACLVSFENIRIDFTRFEEDILSSYKQYSSGDKLILNNKAIVQWVGVNADGLTFKTKASRDSPNTLITVNAAKAYMLQKAPKSKVALSSLRTVQETLPQKQLSALDRLLAIRSYGNMQFQKNSVCLIGKYKFFDESLHDLHINGLSFNSYVQELKLSDEQTDSRSALVLSNTLMPLATNLSSSQTFTSIIIDGAFPVCDRLTDFSKIDSFNYPLFLITDFSEIALWGKIKEQGFDFVFLGEDINESEPLFSFKELNRKLKMYNNGETAITLCCNERIEAIVREIHSITNDNDDAIISRLMALSIQMVNIFSRMLNIPDGNEHADLSNKLAVLKQTYLTERVWLGDSGEKFRNVIEGFERLFSELNSHPLEKGGKFRELLISEQVDYIICPSKGEAERLKSNLVSNGNPSAVLPKVLSIYDVVASATDVKPGVALVIGWPKSDNLIKLLTGFLFAKTTFLYYQFEYAYHISVCKRYQNVQNTIFPKIRKSFFIYPNAEGIEVDSLSDTEKEPVDIVEFETALDKAIYSRFHVANANHASFQTKLVRFENEKFIYATDSHRFLVLSLRKNKSNISKTVVDDLAPGELVVFFNTDKETLVELVDNSATTENTALVKSWAGLWKDLLREYYLGIGSDFSKLVFDLRSNDCHKHEATIKSWLTDDGRIGPDDDADLISIALLTKSERLFENITTVRAAIRKVTGWRFQASDYVIERLKGELQKFTNLKQIVGSKIEINNLGSISILEISSISHNWENIDGRFVNKLLNKNII